MNISERILIEHIKKMAVGSSPGLIKGIGDDCSVFGNTASGSWLVSTDMLVDGIHFDRNLHPPRLLGRKSMAVNLSDIAAMGGIPRFALIAMSLPRDLSSEWLFSWLDGVLEILREYDCCLIGGDTVSGEEMNISVTVLGEQHPRGILYRDGARVGDSVYVSTPLGSSAAGLAILQKVNPKHKIFDTKWETFINAHLDPMPQVHLGQAVCESGCVSAMQDISDGLATDLAHICKESGVGAVIHKHRLPSHPALEEACTSFGLNALECILHGGEDYQLVFTVKNGLENKFENFLGQFGKYSVAAAGEIIEGQGVFLEEAAGIRREISFQGYEHMA